MLKYCFCLAALYRDYNLKETFASGVGERLARILIADDHPVVRMAVRLMLQQAGHQVVGEASMGLEVFAQVQSLNPDVVVLDIDMPSLDGFAVLKRLCIEKIKSKVVVFSGLDASRYAIRCSRAGACGFVSKDDDLINLLSAIQIVLGGYTLFPTTNFASVDNKNDMDSEEARLQELSDREMAVLRRLVTGRRIKDIAEELMLSEKTTSTYKSRIILKLKVDNFLELVELAKRNGLL